LEARVSAGLGAEGLSDPFSADSPAPGRDESEASARFVIPPSLDNDRSATIQQLREMVARFVAEREWERFHSPKNLSMALAIEAAELMEHFQWLSVEQSRTLSDDPERLRAAGEELADVVCYALALANALDLDLTTALTDKMRKNILKYPASRRDSFGFGE
jgi:dCTP diphosphatase